MSTCSRMHALCQPVGETGLCVGHFHSSALAAFFFSFLIAPLLLWPFFFILGRVRFAFCASFFFLVRRCATAFKICTAFDILINHASRRMSHSRGGEGEWREGLSHCGLNFKQSEVRSKATFVKQKCKEQTVQEGSGKQRQPATGLKTKKARKKGYEGYAEC